jgi:hypothetical protein
LLEVGSRKGDVCVEEEQVGKFGSVIEIGNDRIAGPGNQALVTECGEAERKAMSLVFQYALQIVQMYHAAAGGSAD